MALNFLLVSTLLLALTRLSVQDKHYGEQTQFNNHDKNHNNCLEPNEFISLFLDMDNSPHNGEISIMELRDGLHDQHLHDYRDASFFFQEIDRDKDGSISHNDLDFLFRTFDSKDTGCLIYDDFYFEWMSLFNE